MKILHAFDVPLVYDDVPLYHNSFRFLYLFSGICARCTVDDVKVTPLVYPSNSVINSSWSVAIDCLRSRHTVEPSDWLLHL